MIGEKWIECKECDAPEFLKVFELSNMPRTAKISICGLGFFELKINGRRVSDDYFVPAWSDYEKRDYSNLLYPIKDTLTHRVYYMEYDVTDYLKIGENEMTVILGNGWYNQICRNAEGNQSYGKPKLSFDLVIDDMLHIVSDDDMMASESTVVFNNIYYGEKQDFRIKKDYKYKVTYAQQPESELVKQTSPADRIHKLITPKKIATVDGKDIYDCVENISGWVAFTQTGKCSDVTTVRYSEEYDGTALDYISAGGDNQIQSDSYVSNGTDNVCRPKFTYHSFRYFEIEGEYKDLIVEVVYADVDIITEFKCSSEKINKIFENFIRTQCNNMHCGVPSDCPHRERLGYTGDGQLVCDAAMHVLDAESFYKKWMRDVADCQDINNGHVQHTAPFYGGGGGPGGWGCAIVVVPYIYYKNYRDKEILKEYYPNMKKWIEYMLSRSENGLVIREEEDGWCLGDWGIKGKIFLPEPFVNTYFLIKSLIYMEEICDVLSYDKSEISNKKFEIISAFKDAYSDADFLLNGIQGAEAFFIDIGLGDDAMKNKLNERYSNMDRLDTGIFGTDILIRVLFENGYGDTAIRLIENSFAPQIECGATTLWEYWTGEESRNHPMFGACFKYFITEMMGIKKGDILRIEPKLSKYLKNASVNTKIGDKKVNISYETKDSQIEINIYAECEAEFSYLDKKITISPNENKTFLF